MSKIGVSLKISVSEIDKARLFKGQKGIYLDATVFIDLDNLDQYDNSGMITQDVSKEEKQQGVRGNILGNCKVFWSESSQASQQSQQPQQYYDQSRSNESQSFQQPVSHQQLTQPQQPQREHPGVDDFDDDLPF